MLLIVLLFTIFTKIIHYISSVVFDVVKYIYDKFMLLTIRLQKCSDISHYDIWLHYDATMSN